MHIRRRGVSLTQIVILLLFLCGTLAVSLISLVKPAEAASYQMQTGYYVGNGTARNITGLGFQPDLVIIKADGATAGVYKTSAMPTNTVAFLSLSASSTASMVLLTSDGFSLSTATTVNTSNTLYNWTAFGGSDCTATGNFCVGTYTGTGAANRVISTGFAPSLVINKRDSATLAYFRTSPMATDTTEYMANTPSDTVGGLIRSFTSTSFTVGATANASGAAYWFTAFKSTAGSMSIGTYTGNGVDDRSVATGFRPDMVFVKNTTSTTAANRNGYMLNSQQVTNSSSAPGAATANLTNHIQKLESNGFQVGTGVGVNESSATMYWFAFGGVPTTSTASGTYTMASGTYTGDGIARQVTPLGFAPDLVIIKALTNQYGVFRTSIMAGNTTAYMANAAIDFSNGITSMDTDGFSIGTSTLVNGNGTTYHWQAFGNAYRPDTKSGAADFAIGAYGPTAVDDMDVPGPPYQLDMVAIKSAAANIGAYKTSAQTGDLATFFSGALEAANVIQSLGTTGFQVGTNASANVVGGNYRWFGFKVSSKFTVGTYTGTGATQTVDMGAGAAAKLLWVKQSTGSNGVTRSDTMSGDTSSYFTNTSNAASRITAFTQTGFTLGVAPEVNSSAGTYRYVAWRPFTASTLGTDIVNASGIPIAIPSLAMNTTSFPYTCSNILGVLGNVAQKLRVSNPTTSGAWTVSIAPTNGNTATWSNAGNTKQYDYNDANGCVDGIDSDSVAGILRLSPNASTITPQSGCSSANITKGTQTQFVEGSVDAVTIATASSSADTGCYWDITGVTLTQTLPANQASDTYSLNLTITTIAL